ncbi:coadhesin [Eurytemora carolleeae]|uniref:coadhesin n=1 Tax=Eurytemora carolleeae TaxID=1294199 RepID=UPI000C76CDEB|nr:coadhesin [Eurytemora carolleeae]|eukprot:XP_023338929.1 coadhesin-like [Eurytemora affinis]
MILPFILVGAFFMHVETKKYLIETLEMENSTTGISGYGEHSYVGSDKGENEEQGEGIGREEENVEEEIGGEEGKKDGGIGRQEEKEEGGEDGDGNEDNDEEEGKEGGGEEEEGGKEKGGVVNEKEGNGHEGEDYSAHPSWLQRKGVGFKNYKEGRSSACSLTSWSPWAQASNSPSCSQKKEYRKRKCKQGRKSCPPVRCGNKKLKEFQSKPSTCCNWGAWAEWSLPEHKCVDSQVQRKRVCKNSDASSGFYSMLAKCTIEDCRKGPGPLDDTETKIMPGVPCCAWSTWMEWSTPNNICVSSQVTRKRVCESTAKSASPYAANRMICTLESCNQGHGAAQDTETKEIVGVSCCGWSTWGDWSTPADTCVDSQVKRKRNCLSSANKSKFSAAQVSCTVDDCKEGFNPPVDAETKEVKAVPCCNWSSWEEWSTPQDKCVDSEIKRKRECVKSSLSNAHSRSPEMCPAEFCQQHSKLLDRETKIVTGVNCCTWSSWVNVGPCNVSCGTGAQKRVRECQGGNYCTLQSCQGTNQMNYPCKKSACPASGYGRK